MLSRAVIPAIAAILAIALFSSSEITEGSELPAGLLCGVLVADFMHVTSVAEVKGDYFVTIEAPDKSVTDIVAWFESQLKADGWNLGSRSVSATSAILPFQKSDRKCGVSVTDFVLDATGQLDRSVKGITVQVSKPKDPTEGAVEASSDVAGEGAQ